MRREIPAETRENAHDLHNHCLDRRPNTGKTYLFNQLISLRQRVANWPGVTFKKRSGPFRLGALEGTAVDLPGIYSLTPAET